MYPWQFSKSCCQGFRLFSGLCPILNYPLTPGTAMYWRKKKKRRTTLRVHQNRKCLLNICRDQRTTQKMIFCIQECNPQHQYMNMTSIWSQANFAHCIVRVLTLAALMTWGSVRGFIGYYLAPNFMYYVTLAVKRMLHIHHHGREWRWLTVPGLGLVHTQIPEKVKRNVQMPP